MSYSYILFDVDGTLIDFNKTYHSAIGRLLEYDGQEAADKAINQYYSLSDEVWFGMNMDDSANPHICRNYHPMYFEYFYRTNERAICTMNFKHNAQDLTDYFMNELGKCALPNINAVEICQKLYLTHTLCIASNGLTKLQMSKLGAFTPYLHSYFISEDMDCIKPEAEYFQIILNSLKCSPSDCIMVGDSLKNDIAGANYAGITSCYYNPLGIENNTEIIPDHEIRDFSELLDFV